MNEPEKKEESFSRPTECVGESFFFLRFLLFYILDLSRRGRRAPRGSESSKPRQHRHAQLEEALQHRFYSCCSGTGAAQTGHVASLIPRLPTHRSSHSWQQARWKAWPHASCIRGLSSSKGSRQVGHESSSSSTEEGRRFVVVAVVSAFRLGLLEGRGGAAMALDVAVVVEGGAPSGAAAAAAAAATAAAAAAASVAAERGAALESSGVPSSEEPLVLLLSIPRRPPKRASSSPLPRRRPPPPPAAETAGAAREEEGEEEEEEEEAVKLVAARPPPPRARGDSGGDSGLGGGLYSRRMFPRLEGDAMTRETEPRRLRAYFLVRVGERGKEDVRVEV